MTKIETNSTNISQNRPQYEIQQFIKLQKQNHIQCRKQQDVDLKTHKDKIKQSLQLLEQKTRFLRIRHYDQQNQNAKTKLKSTTNQEEKKNGKFQRSSIKTQPSPYSKRSLSQETGKQVINNESFSSSMKSNSTTIGGTHDAIPQPNSSSLDWDLVPLQSILQFNNFDFTDSKQETSHTTRLALGKEREMMSQEDFPVLVTLYDFVKSLFSVENNIYPISEYSSTKPNATASNPANNPDVISKSKNDQENYVSNKFTVINLLERMLSLNQDMEEKCNQHNPIVGSGTISMDDNVNLTLLDSTQIEERNGNSTSDVVKSSSTNNLLLEQRQQLDTRLFLETNDDEHKLNDEKSFYSNCSADSSNSSTSTLYFNNDDGYYSSSFDSECSGSP